MNELNFTPDKRLDRKERALMEVLAYACGYTSQPSLSYERRDHENRDMLVLHSECAGKPWAIMSEIKPLSEHHTDVDALNASRRRVLRAMFISAFCEAADTVALMSEPLEIVRCAGFTALSSLPESEMLSIECALLELVCGDRLHWKVKEYGHGVQVKIQISGSGYDGQDRLISASLWSEDADESIEETKQQVRVRLLDRLIRSEAEIVERHTARYRARVASSAQAEA